VLVRVLKVLVGVPRTRNSTQRLSGLMKAASPCDAILAMLPNHLKHLNSTLIGLSLQLALAKAKAKAKAKSEMGTHIY